MQPSTLESHSEITAPVGDEAFTKVRRRGRKAENWRKKTSAEEEVANGGGQVRSQAAPVAKDKGTIKTSNRFGNLDKIMEGSDLREEELLLGGDKENVDLNIINQGNEGKRVDQASSVVFGAQSSRKGDGPQLGQRVRQDGSQKTLSISKVTVNKVVGKTGPLIRKTQTSKPKSGLIFGPTGEELVLSTSGKRLRTESNVAGRPGGAFVVDVSRRRAEVGGDMVPGSITSDSRMEPT